MQISAPRSSPSYWTTLCRGFGDLFFRFHVLLVNMAGSKNKKHFGTVLGSEYGPRP